MHIPDLPRGDAIDFKPNTTPHAGAAVLFQYSDGTHHIAYITEMGPTSFHVTHYNKEKCKKTTEWVDYDNEFITGFYEPMSEDDGS